MEAERYVARVRPATGPKPRGARAIFGTRSALALAFSTPRLTPSRSPQIDASELKATLNAMGQNPTEEEIFQMISQVDDDNSGEIEFAEFMKVIENQKASAAKASDETDTIEAFVALGGNADKTGEISTEKLRAVVKVRAR
jgi:Ca2+-binding EF-hand superfamily protein